MDVRQSGPEEDGAAKRKRTVEESRAGTRRERRCSYVITVGRGPTIRSPSAPTELRPDTGEGASGRLGRLETSPSAARSNALISEQTGDDFLGLLGEHLLLLVQIGLPGRVVPD